MPLMDFDFSATANELESEIMCDFSRFFALRAEPPKFAGNFGRNPTPPKFRKTFREILSWTTLCVVNEEKSKQALVRKLQKSAGEKNRSKGD